MIKWKQADMGLADFGLDYGNPDFVRYAESYGASRAPAGTDGRAGWHCSKAASKKAACT